MGYKLFEADTQQQATANYITKINRAHITFNKC